MVFGASPCKDILYVVLVAEISVVELRVALLWSSVSLAVP